MKGEAVEGRYREVLSAVVRMHIATGTPVASASIAEQGGRRLSPATIRHVMAALADRGYLSQPHTSAGRVPTAQAYEFYAQEVASQARLSLADEHWIECQLTQPGSPGEDLFVRAPHVLAELCHAVALVLVAPFTRLSLEEIRFLPLAGHRVLAVAVTRAGRACNTVVRTRGEYANEELARMTAYLNQNFHGWSLEAIRTEMERRVAAERSEFRAFLLEASTLCQASCLSITEPGELHLEGLANLLTEGARLDQDAIREVLRTLEEKERLAELLRDCVESSQAGPHVRIGLEQLSPSLKEFALIGAGYGAEDRLAGSVGLLGPTRMDYARAITAVNYVAALINRALTAEN